MEKFDCLVMQVFLLPGCPCPTDSEVNKKLPTSSLCKFSATGHFSATVVIFANYALCSA